MSEHPSISTLAVHADDDLNRIPALHSLHLQDVAPAMHVSTTYRHPSRVEDMHEAADVDIASLEGHVYSRETAPNTTRLEAILSGLMHGKALVYASGLAAIFAAYTHLKPRRVSIGEGYHGSHDVLAIHSRLTGLEILPLDCAQDALGPGDVIHLETPVNPYGEAYDIQAFADKAHAVGALLFIDSTLGPPGLQDPFKHGADIVMHSGTKYIGGHSDLLCGILVVRDDETGRRRWRELWDDRMNMGNVMGNMEGWLAVRSVRTLELRVRQQSRSAGELVRWLDALLNGDKFEDEAHAEVVPGLQRTVASVHHASLQARLPSHAFLATQMPNGYAPLFCLVMQSVELARALPGRLRYFHHATSLGGVESLVEWRALSDPRADRRIVRFSIGVEAVEDLKRDIAQAIQGLQA